MVNSSQDFCQLRRISPLLEGEHPPRKTLGRTLPLCSEPRPKHGARVINPQEPTHLHLASSVQFLASITILPFPFIDIFFVRMYGTG